MIRTSIDGFGDREFTINLIVYVFMAESRGFEPLEHSRVLLFSGQVQLAALPTLRAYFYGGN